MTTSTLTDYSTIQSVFISFSNELLNASASDSAHDFDDFFDSTGVILDANLLSVIETQVHQILDICEGQPARIPSLINKLYCKCYSTDSDGTLRLRNQSSVEKAFQEAVRRNETVIKIIVMTDSLCH
jgi:hypothetical protein